MPGNPERIDISREPDMYIIAGDLKGERTGSRLYVNSAILKAASPVFRAMLGPNFAEGASLNSSPMHEQLLPEDEEEATWLAMALIHHSYELVPNRLTPSQVFGITKFASKYDMIPSLRSDVYIHCQYPLQEVHEFWRGNCIKSCFEIMAISYVFRFSQLFSQYSNAIIQQSDGILKAGRHEDAEQYLPDEIIDLLNEAQMDMRMRMAVYWGERKDKFGRGPESDAHTQEFQESSRGKRSTIDHQLKFMKQDWAIPLSYELIEWTRQGLTYSLAEGTVKWEADMRQDL